MDSVSESDCISNELKDCNYVPVAGVTSDVHPSEDSDPQGTVSTLEGIDKAREEDNKKKSSRKSKKGSRIFKCSTCNYSSTERYMLTRHQVSHSDERKFKCNICERGFKTKTSLQYHLNIHTGRRPYPCPSCDRKFKNPQQVISHKRYKHSNTKPHKCPQCSYASTELCKLKRHMNCHSMYRPHQCPHCTYSSSEIYNLKRHLRRHTGIKPFECTICRVRFSQSNSLKVHRMMQHPTGSKQVGLCQCDICNRKFKQERYLRVHMLRYHTAKEPVACKTCGRFFPDKYTCQMHSKTHLGKKCNKCCFCSYACKLPNHLKKHMRKHTGEKPYICDYCNHSFSQKQKVKSHIFTCHISNDVSPTPPEERLRCAHCSQTFTHKGTLRRHMHDHGFQPHKTVSVLRGNQPNKNQEIDYQQKEVTIANNEESFPGEMLAIGSQGYQQLMRGIINLKDRNRGLEAAVISEDNADPDSLRAEVVHGIQLQDLRNKLTEWNVENYFGFDEASISNERTAMEEERELQNIPDVIPLQDCEALETKAVMTGEDGAEPQAGEIPIKGGKGLEANGVMTDEDGEVLSG